MNRISLFTLLVYLVIFGFGFIYNFVSDVSSLHHYSLSSIYFENNYLIALVVMFLSISIPILNQSWHNRLFAIPIIVGAYVYSSAQFFFLFFKTFTVHDSLEIIWLVISVGSLFLLYEIYKLRLWAILSLCALLVIFISSILYSYLTNEPFLEVGNVSIIISLLTLLILGYLIFIVTNWSKVAKLKLEAT